MNKTHSIILGALAATVLAIGAQAAENGRVERDDAAALAQAKVSISQAISVAEQHANGKAARAELEDENGKMVYGVEVVGAGKTTDVKVDINTGQVLSAKADQADHEGNENEHEGRD